MVTVSQGVRAPHENRWHIQCENLYPSQKRPKVSDTVHDVIKAIDSLLTGVLGKLAHIL